jgi:acetyl esterase/lipase
VNVLFLILSILLGISSPSFADEYQTIPDIPYRKNDSTLTAYQKERCHLDLYRPTAKKKYAIIVWFHGGGLTGGNKEIPKALMKKGHAIVAVNYRLSPKVKVTDCLDDAAAAVAWVFKNIQNHGGDPTQIFLSGHSAGGYLTSMLGLDQSLLKKHGVEANQLAGLLPYSGHTITHFTVRKERGIDAKRPVIDDMAPLFHIRSDAPPILLITGDRELEMLGRYEENAYFYRMMKVVGHKDITLFELDGYGHQIPNPAHPLLLKFLERVSKAKKLTAPK